ncbi:MAG: MBL fold metallo-hydrolase [Bacillota bacterium]|nr:MBL fold metallo-hydrolase [Bacillota bacterium]
MDDHALSHPGDRPGAAAPQPLPQPERPERLEAGLLRLRPPVPGPLGWTNSYLARDEDGRWSVLDPGLDWPPARRLWESAARELAWAKGAIREVVVSHFHPDHLGLAGWLVERWGGRVLAHARELPLIRRVASPSPAERERYLAVLRAYLVENGVPGGETEALLEANPLIARASSPLPRLEALHDGALFRFGPHRAVALWTPGHTAGHLCLHLPEPALLLSGDHVLERITPNVSLWPGGAGEPLEEYLGSLRRLERLPVSRVLPAHRESLDDLAARLAQLQAHHRERLERCHEAVARGPATAYELVFRLFSPEVARTQQLFALGETLAHLRWLERHGRIRRLAGKPGDPVRFAAR